MGVALTIGLIEWVDGSATGVADLALLVVRQLALGLAVGLAVGAASAWLLIRLPTIAVPFAPVASVAVGAVGFGLADIAGGSGFLAVYLVGLFVGNTATALRDTLVSFHSGLAFLAQVGLFIVLGLFSFPHQLVAVILPGLAVVVVLLFVGTPRRSLAVDPLPGVRSDATACCSAGPGCAERCRSCSRPTHRPPGCRRAARSSTPSSSSSSRRR